MESTDNLEIITVEELMELLYIGKNTAYQLLHDGAIRAFHIGSTWKIPRAAVDEYIIERCKSRKTEIDAANKDYFM